MAQLRLEPNYGQAIADPIPVWFSDLLTSTGDKFDTLAKATYELDNWATHAEIMQYHHINTECCKIEEEMVVLRARLSLDNEALDGCWYRIEASRVPHMLRNLQGRSDFPLRHGEQLGRHAGGRPRGVTGPGVPV